MKAIKILLLALIFLGCKKEEVKQTPAVPTCECKNQKEKYQAVNVGGTVQMQWVIYYISTLETTDCSMGTDYVYTSQIERNKTVCK